MNHGLCWLGVAKNRLQRVSHLQNLSSLAVLDVSDNKMSRCPNQQHRRICFRSAQLPVEVSYNKYIYIYIAILRLDGLHGLPSLKALIAARNEIAILEGLTPKKIQCWRRSFCHTTTWSHSLSQAGR